MEEPLLASGRHPDDLADEARRRELLQQEEARMHSARMLCESLDYESVQSRVHYGRMRDLPGNRHFFGYTGSTLAKYLVTILTGITIGCIAYLIEEVVLFLKISRNSWVERAFHRGGFLHSLGGCTTFGIIMAGFAALLVQLVAPAAAGGGVSGVMAYLNGNHIPNLLRWRTLLTKILGIMCACASGLAVGPEGPLVHIGTSVASCLAWLPGGWRMWPWAVRLLNKLGITDAGTLGGPPQPTQEGQGGSRYKPRPFFNLYSDTDHREFLSAGAAAGLAAAFGAPIGGVLFSLEEASSYWSPKVTWRCFLCAATASFTLAQVDRSVEPGMLTFTGLSPSPASDWLFQLPFLVVLGGAAGCLGAAFNLLRSWVQKVRVPKKNTPLRVLEVAVVVAGTLAVMFILSYHVGSCLPRPKAWEMHGPKSRWNRHHYGMTFPVRGQKCPKESYNDLATIFLSPPQETVKKLFGMGEDPTIEGKVPFTLLSLIVYSGTFLLLMSAAAGIAVPSGMFLPSIMVGSSFGAVLGLLLQRALGTSWRIQPGVYSLVGATAVLGGVFRSSISLVVIIVEGTGGIDYLFGVILAIVMSHWVGHFIHPEGVYETEVEQDGAVTFLRKEPPRALTLLTAAHIMASPVLGVREVDAVDDLVRLLRSTRHNGFPVLGAPAGPGSRHAGGRGLEGMILRSQLLVLLQHRVFQESSEPGGGGSSVERERFLEEEMRAYHSRHNKHRRHLSSRADEVDSLHLGDAAANPDRPPLYVDLSPYMNRAPITVRMECSASRVHELFLTLGLRHLCVVDHLNHVVGIITRKDLDRYAGPGWWRITAPQQEGSSPAGAAALGHHPAGAP